MRSQLVRFLAFVSRFVAPSYAFPAAHECHQHSPCVTIASTESNLATTTDDGISSYITSPVSSDLLAIHPKADVFTATCSGDECSIFDVTSSLITVVSLQNVTGPSRGPFANSTSTGQQPAVSTASGTDTFTEMATSLTYSMRLNSSTTVTSRVTLSITTITASEWDGWRPEPVESQRNSDTSASTPSSKAWDHTFPVTGSGGTMNPVSATGMHSLSNTSRWSVWSASNGTLVAPKPTLVNSTNIPSTQTFTTTISGSGDTSCNSGTNACPTSSVSVSYVATSSYLFSGTTIIIPVPSGYEWPGNSAVSTTPRQTNDAATSSLNSARYTSTISTFSCWTTSDRFSSATVTSITPTSSKICWILSCDADDKCSDHVSRYPVTVDSELMSSIAPYRNHTTAPVTTSASHFVETVSATPSNNTYDTLWKTWSGHGESSITSSLITNATTSTETYLKGLTSPLNRRG